MGSVLRAGLRGLVYLCLTLTLMPVQAAALSLSLPLRETLPRWYHRRCCQILGFHIERRGQQSDVHPTLYVANHVSYFDISILGSLIRGSFVAKTEVAAWPLFGWLAKLQRTVFVARRGRDAGSNRDEISARLQSGGNLILFPEGTSSDGNRVLPFKSALFAVAAEAPNGRPLCVQAVSISYTRLDDVPMGRYLRPFFAWFGDMKLAGHLWHAIGLGQVTVVVEFHKPVTLADFGCRKALSAHCQEVVSMGVAAALAGHGYNRAAVDKESAAGRPKPAVITCRPQAKGSAV